MSTTLKTFALPSNFNGLSISTPIAAWTYGGWSVICPNTTNDIYIQDIAFQVTYVGATDTTFEALFEIGKGCDNNSTTIAQVPYSFKNDTAVGYYLDTYVFNFPEPIYIPMGTRLNVRATDSVAAALTYNGIKLRYQAVNILIDKDADTNNYQRIQVGNGMSTSIGGVI